MAVPPLVASYYTLAGFRPMDGPHQPSPIDLRQRIEAAAKAGYAGIGTDVMDLMASVERHGHDGIRAMLADNGLTHFEVEGMGDWYASGAGRAASDAARREVLIAAEKIGVTQIKVTGNIAGRSHPVATMRTEFATLAGQAADAGSRLTLEIVCISDIADVATALEVVGDTAATNGGFLADIWHFVRGHQPYDTILDAPHGTMAWVELDDGAAKPTGSIISEQLDDRRLPGEGAFDITGFLAAVRQSGYAGGVGVEILSDRLRALPVEEAARLSFESAARQFIN